MFVMNYLGPVSTPNNPDEILSMASINGDGNWHCRLTTARVGIWGKGTVQSLHRDDPQKGTAAKLSSFWVGSKKKFWGSRSGFSAHEPKLQCWKPPRRCCPAQPSCGPAASWPPGAQLPPAQGTCPSPTRLNTQCKHQALCLTKTRISLQKGSEYLAFSDSAQQDKKAKVFIAL